MLILISISAHDFLQLTVFVLLNGFTIFDAGKTFDKGLLREYEKRNSSIVRIVCLDHESDYLYAKLAEDDQDAFGSLEMKVEHLMHHSGISNLVVRTRCFAPSEMPAILNTSPKSVAQLKIDAFLSNPTVKYNMEDVYAKFQQETFRSPIYLTLNAKNELIRRLVNFEEFGDDLERVMMGLYNSSMPFTNFFKKNAHSGSVYKWQDKTVHCSVEWAHSGINVCIFPDNLAVNISSTVFSNSFISSEFRTSRKLL